MKQMERIAGFILLAIVVLFGMFGLSSSMLYFRLLMGVLLGYALSRGYMGFAGSVNRAYNGGSTKLMRALMFMFFVTAAVSTAVLYNADVSKFDLWINPINIGLLLGGLLFGFGMAFSSCCASGVLTDLVAAFPRAFVTLIFFCMGVFVGFPIQNTASWVQDSLIKIEGKNGVYFPDLFGFDGLQGYLGALILTGILCLIVVKLSYIYENRRKKAGTYFGVISETAQLSGEKKSLEESGEVCPFCENGYEKIFVRPWSLKTATLVISAVFILLMGVTKAGWGASTPYGFWFGKILMVFGVKADAIVEFTKGVAGPYEMPFFKHPINVQNIGIVLGTLFYMLTSNSFLSTCKASLKINAKQAFFYALGGFAMGFGTRLANGCNVGALYTPIANFSLSGWIFLVVLVAGGIIGNMVAKKVHL
ncbi:YeeE/YedE family protein [Bulleidia sp. zg-1006]|uniref:YeeE/YedE family protein n=1 Tax=Bulleidia sp. zg-1006 TaxID=2806552 RepID=UPI0019393A9B|nr:YeeE/YedE family protein [Bulleidia sp. zg-1006]QRG86881.1 YeeE/YedE family protein [Bulleidia sp. zg-1006]